VLVHDGRIVAVGPESTVSIPRGAQRIDCRGKFVTAGFWNSHVHIFGDALLNARSAPATELNDQLDSMLNRWGFTTVFDIASVLDNTLALRRRIDSGVVRGPASPRRSAETQRRTKSVFLCAPPGPLR
jgi:imidazolonepropionase-like amidohydrolase